RSSNSLRPPAVVKPLVHNPAYLVDDLGGLDLACRRSHSAVGASSSDASPTQPTRRVNDYLAAQVAPSDADRRRQTTAPRPLRRRRGAAGGGAAATACSGARWRAIATLRLTLAPISPSAQRAPSAVWTSTLQRTIEEGALGNGGRF